MVQNTLSPYYTPYPVLRYKADPVSDDFLYEIFHGLPKELVALIRDSRVKTIGTDIYTTITVTRYLLDILPIFAMNPGGKYVLRW